MARAPLRRREQSDETPYIPPELKGLPERLLYARSVAQLSITEAGTSRWERGLRLKKASAVEFIRVANRLHANVGWLLTGEGDAPRPRRRKDAEPIRAEEVEEE